MTFTHDDIQARLIDFLYGEIDGEARAAFDAHVAACPSCRAEVTAFQKTRATAREVVRAPLADAVPAPVRARVMEAVLREATARAAGATPRWLAWLRSHWTLPVLTTAAAMGALLLFREPLFREARRPLGDKTAEELMPGSASAPAPGAAAPASPAVEAKAEGAAPDSESEVLKGAKLGSRGESPAGAPQAEAKRGSNKVADNRASKATANATPRASPRGRQDKGDGVDQVLGKMRADKPARPADVKDAQPKPAKGSLDDLLEGTLSRSAPRTQASAPAVEKQEARAPAKSVSSSVAVEEEIDQDRKSFAQPPPSVVRKTPAPEEAPASASRAKKGKASNKEERPLSDDESVASANAPAESAAPSPSGAGSRPSADPAAVLVDRAEKLMTARRWTQAAAAYRDLLQRFPQHAAVPTWRRRLAAAQVAAAQDQNQPSDSGFATPPPPR